MRLFAIAPLWLIYQFTASIGQIIKVADPSISWSNIGFGAPVIKLFFSIDANFLDSPKDFWLKLTIPFYARSLSPEWSVDNCSPNQSFTSTIEQRAEVASAYTVFYVQLTGATFQSGLNYVLKLSPDTCTDFLGFSDPLQIALVSKPAEDHVVFALNSAFCHFFGSPAPVNDLVVKQLARGTDCLSMAQKCSQIIKVKFSNASNIFRIVVQLTGDFIFDNFDSNSCSLVSTGTTDAADIPKSAYSCKLSDQFGDSRRFLVFESSIALNPASYFLKFESKTPSGPGTQSIRVFTMDQYSPTVVSFAELTKQFSVQPFAWASGFPKMRFSFGFDAADATLPYYLGLYSTSRSYNQVLNSITIYLQARDLPFRPGNLKFSIKIYLGVPNPIFPLGQIRDSFKPILGFEKIYTRSGDNLLIDNIQLELNVTYNISFKIGFADALELNNDSRIGFGVAQIFYNENILVTGQAAMRLGFTKVIDNKNIYLPESVDTAQIGYHRGYSAFRSATSAQLAGTAANYRPKPNRHGLRVGDGQEFFVQSSVGPVSLYTSSAAILPDHNSSKSFVQVVTHPSIRSATASFPDSAAQTNCKLYSAVFNKWASQLAKPEGQTVLDPTLTTIITTEPPSYNPIAGCAYSRVNYPSSDDRQLYVSQFRMRFKDLNCVDQNAQACHIVGVKLALPYTNAQLANPAQQAGNLFVFNNVDVLNPLVDSNSGDDFYILDAFFHVYLFSNLQQTNQPVSSLPNILMMDNLYILTEAATSFVNPSDLTFFLQNMYYEVSGSVRTFNDNSLFPAVLQLHGKFNGLSVDTTKIRLFFESLEPLPVNETSVLVDCAAQGLKAKSCRLEKGVAQMQTVTYKAASLQNAQLLYMNSRMTSSLLIEIDKTSIVDANNEFVLSFPINLLGSASTETYLSTSSGTLPAFPGFQFLDDADRQIQLIDFGSINSFFGLYSYSPTYLIASLNILTAAQIQTIYDSTVGNEPAQYTSFGYTDKQAGKQVTLEYKVTGTGFKRASLLPTDYTSATFCSDQSFFDSLFTGQNTVGISYFSQCQIFKYLNRFCVICAELQSPQTTFNFANVILPASNGLRWPSNSVSVISNGPPLAVLDHVFDTNPLSPNVLALSQTEIKIPFKGVSFALQLDLTLTNFLSANQFLILSKTSGDFNIRLNGDNSKPFCKISQSSQIADCFFSVVSNAIKIRTPFALQASQIFSIELFGLSTQSSDPITALDLEVYSAIDDSLTASAKIDSSLPALLRLNYDRDISSGQLSIDTFDVQPPFSYVPVDLHLTLTVTGRKLMVSDGIYIDLGCKGLLANSKVEIVDSETNKTISQIASVEILSRQELVLQDFSDMSRQSFRLMVYNFNITADNDLKVIAQYTFNNGFVAFKAPRVDYPSLARLPQTLGSVTLKYSGAGFKGGIDIYITPKLTVRTSDIIFIRFPATFSPRLSNHPLYTFEDNFGLHKVNTWLYAPFILALNGFKNDFDAGRSFKITIYGLQFSDKETELWAFIALEDGFNNCKEAVKLIVPPAIAISNIESLTVRQLLFSSHVLRTQGDIGFRVAVARPLSKSQSILLGFDHLTQELLKPLTPSCLLYKISKSKFVNYADLSTAPAPSQSNTISNMTQALQLIDDILGDAVALNSCEFIGNTLILSLAEDVNTEFIILANGIPTPDTLLCRFLQPTVVVTNAPNTKTLMASSPLSSNARKMQFGGSQLLAPLSYNDYTDGVIDVYRGFYRTVSIIIDSSFAGDDQTFNKSLSFILLNNEEGSFVTQTYNPRTGKPAQAEIGGSAAELVIGAQTDASLFTYALIIGKQEAEPLLYTDLPILNMRVLGASFSLQHASGPIYVYKDGQSLPIIIKSPNYPVDEHYFTIKVTGNGAANIKIKGEIDEFSLNFANSLILITLEGFNLNNNVDATLELAPIDSTLFLPSRISLILASKESDRKDNFNVTVVSANYYSARVQVTSDNQAYFASYISPAEGGPTNLTQSFIENMARAGSETRNGMFFKLATHLNVNSPYYLYFDGLKAGTQYVIRGFYTISSLDFKGNFTCPFSTKTTLSN